MIKFFEFEKDGTTRKYQSEFYPKSKILFDNKTKNQISASAKLNINNRLIQLQNDDIIIIDDDTYRVISIDVSVIEVYTNYWLVKQARSERQY